eukprot:COSAG06_NODE_834_length_11974_cov_5.664739_11_plen_116_part_00
MSLGLRSWRRRLSTASEEGGGGDVSDTHYRDRLDNKHKEESWHYLIWRHRRGGGKWRGGAADNRFCCPKQNYRVVSTVLYCTVYSVISRYSDTLYMQTYCMTTYVVGAESRAAAS